MYASGREKGLNEALNICTDLLCDRVMQQLSSLDNLLSLDERVVSTDMLQDIY